MTVDEIYKKKMEENPNGLYSDVDRIYWAKYGESIGENISNRVNTWIANSNHYLSLAQNRFSGDMSKYRSDSSDWLDTFDKKYWSFMEEAHNIKSVLERYKDFFDADYVSSVIEALDSSLDAQNNVMTASIQDRDFWSQFDSEEAYNAWYKEYLNATRWDEYKQYANSEEASQGWQKYLADEEAKAQKEKEKSDSPPIKINEDDNFLLKGLKKVGNFLFEMMSESGHSSDTSLPMHMTSQVIHDNQRGIGADLNTKPKEWWTDEQKKIYGYLYNTSRLSAVDYAIEINTVFKEKRDLEWIKNSATANGWAGVAHTVGAIASAPLGLADFLDDLVKANTGQPIGEYDGTVSPFEYSQAVTGGISTHLNNTYGTLNESIPIIGGKGLGDVYGLGTSIAQSAASGYTLGGVGTLVSYFGQGAASGVDDALSRGASEEQAILYGTLVGLAEGTAESIGVDNLFKLGASPTVKTFIKNTLKQAGAEGIEEALTSIMSNAIDNIVMGDKSNFNAMVNAYMAQGMTKDEAQKKAWKDSIEGILYDSLGGFISGGVHGGVRTGVLSAIDNHKVSQKYGDNQSIQDLLVKAVDIGGEAANVADKYIAKYGKKGKLSGANLNELVYTNEQELRVQDKAKIKSAAEAKLAEYGETGDVSAIADILVRQAKGEELSSKDWNTLNNSKAGHLVSGQLNPDNIMSGALNDDWATHIGTARINPTAYNRDLYELAKAKTGAKEDEEKASVAKAIDGAKKVDEANIKVSENGKNQYYDAEAKDYLNADIKGVVSTKGGVKVELENGKTVSINDLVYASRTEGVMYEMIANMGVTPDTANEILNTFKPSNTKQAYLYFDSIPLAYRMGLMGNKQGLKFIKLSDAQKRILYNRGRIDAVTNAKERDSARATSPNKATAEASKTEKDTAKASKTEKKGIIFEKGYVYDEAKANDRQKAGMAGAEIIAKTTNLEVHVFDSKLESDPNGYFKDGNKIYINVSAGMKAEGAMLYAMSHEVGHYIRKWNAQGFKELADFLIAEYGKNGVDVNSLIERQKDKIRKRYSQNGWTLPSDAKLFDMAYEEMVADAMSDMLADPNAYKKLAKLKKKNFKLWQKLGEIIKQLLDKLKNALNIYRENSPVAEEAFYVRDFTAEAYNKLQDLYIKAFVEADANYEASKGSKETVDEALKHSDRDNDVDTKINQSTSSDDTQLSDRDSEGNTLSKEQMEFFKDSKVRDENGNLLVVYHGSPKGRTTIFDKSKTSKDNDMGQGIYFSSDVENASTYLGETKGKKLYRAYLNFKNPFIISDNTTMTLEEARDLLLLADERYAARDTFWYLAREVKDGTITTSKFANTNMSIHMTEMLEKSGKYDGIIDETVADKFNLKEGTIHYIALEANQIKDISNKTPTSNSDIRYSDRDSDYLDAVKRGDMETAQKMVDEAAKAAGHNYHLYHGTDADFTEFDLRKFGGANGKGEGYGIYLAANREISAPYGKNVIDSYTKFNRLAEGRKKTLSYSEVKKLVKRSCEREAQRAVEDGEYDTVSEALKDAWVSNYVYTYDYSSMDRVYTDVADMLWKENDNDGDIINEVMTASGAHYDYNNALNFYEFVLTPATGIDGFHYIWGNKDGIGVQNDIYLAFYSEQIKSADPVTYDDNGDVIPLSERFNSEDNDIRYSLRGTNEDGIEVYETSEEIKKLPIKERQKVFLDIMKNEYRGRTAKFTRNGHYYYASFDYRDINKNIYGDKLSDKKGWRAKINVGAEGEIFELVENGKYNGSKPESGKNIDAHKGVGYWDYFIKVVQIDNTVFDLIANVRKKADGEFVYSIQLNENKKIEASPSLGSPNGVLNRMLNASDNRISQNPNSVKSEFSDADEKLSDRDTDAVSNRTLLANALESVAQNDIEKTKLTQYKEKIALIDAEQKKLNDIRAEANSLRFKKGRTAEETKKMRDLDSKATQTANRINTYDKQLLNLEATSALKNVLEREKTNLRKKIEQKGKEALNAQRAKNAETVREIMTRNTESRKKAIEGRHKTEMRHKIQKVVSELDNLLRNPTAKKHIKEELRKEVAEALSAINMDTVGADERVAHYDALIAKATDPDVIEALKQTRDRIQLQGDNLKGKLAVLQNAYEKIKNSEDIELSLAYQEAIHNSIKNVAEKVGDTSIRNMSLEQLEMVYELFTMIRHTVRDANKAFNTKKGETIMQMAEAVNDQVRTVGGQPYKHSAIKAALMRGGWTLLKPFVAFRTIGSVTLTNLYRELRNGEDTFYTDVKSAQAFIEEQYDKHGYKSWNMKETKEFTAKSGKSFKLTLEQMMTLYAYSKREQAHKHIMEGGIVFDDALIVEKKKGIPVKYEVTTKDAFNLSEETFAEIANSLTAEQKAFVDAMQEYLSTTMGEKGNEVSMKLLGVKLFKERFYLPIKSSQYYRNFSAEEAGEVKLRSPAFSKETIKHANNPIVLHNFTDLWAEHINDMSMYHSFVLALEDFTKVYNYKTKTDEKVETMDTKATLETAYPGVTKYINKFLRDMNGGVRAETVGWAEKLTSLSKKGAVLGSLSVSIQQPSAMMRAMAMVNPKHFVATSVKSLNLVKHKQDWEELKKYAPIAGIKEMGRFDVGMGQGTIDWIQSNKTLMEKGEDILSATPAYMDEITWVAIWNAVKRETAHNNPNLKVDSDELLNIAGERFTEVISMTQVYDSVFSRSDIMRNKSWIAKALTAFMAEPTTTLNMLWDAWIQGKRTGNFKGFVKTASAPVGAVLSATVLNAALKSIVMAMRDDDEDESYIEKYLESFVGDLKDSLNPLTLVPVAKDVVSIFNGYDVERMDMALISDLKNAIDAFDSDSKSGYEKWSGFIGAVSAFFGVPVKNVERDVRAVINTFFGSKVDTTKLGMLEAIKEGWTGEETPKGDRLYDAIVSGDEAYISRIRSGYADDKAFETAVKKALRENDTRIKEAAKELNSGNIRAFSNYINTIVAEGHFDEELVENAIRTEMNAFNSKISKAAEAKSEGDDEKYKDIVRELREAYSGIYSQDDIVNLINKAQEEQVPETEEKEEVTSIYSGSDINSAFDNGDYAMAQQIISELINTKVANGMEEKEAKSSLRSSMTSYWKPLYKEAYQSGDTEEMARIRKILYSSGLYGITNDVVKTTQGWLKS